MDFQIDIAEPDLTPGPLGHYPPVLTGAGTIPMRVCPLCRVVLDAPENVCPRDGQSPVELEPDAVPAELAERFTILEPLALGDSGTLFLADDRQTGRRGVLKILRFKGGANIAERQRLKRELVKQA